MTSKPVPDRDARYITDQGKPTPPFLEYLRSLDHLRSLDQSSSDTLFFLPAGGTTNDTTAVQGIFDQCDDAGGGIVIGKAGATYTVDTITVGSNTTLVGGGSVFNQRAAGSTYMQAVLDLNGVTNVRIQGVKIVGTTTPGGGVANAVSGNTGIIIRGSSDRVWVTGCDIRQSLFFPIWVAASSHVYIQDNYFFENAVGVRLSGASNIVFSGNIINRTCLYSLTPTANQFSIGIGLDSTDPVNGVTYAVCTDVVIEGNSIEGLPYSQGVLVHAGVRITIANNTIKNSSIGISVNPYNYTDTCYCIAITGNTIEGTNATTLPAGSGDSGITVQAGGSTSNILACTISGNTVIAANRVELHVSLGGYQIGWTEGLSMTGNVASGCGGNGFIFASTETGAAISGNVARAVVAIGTTQRGFSFAGSPAATLMGNMAVDIAGANGIGFYAPSPAALLWKDSGGNLLNGTSNVTTASA